ncbi:hypothetical protein NEDG_00164 [Nematocida displodere]|uniref:G domain-containing protein n=1 Tax=Nematocida displodere TaxID=1805483 RepID=A0A177EL32_9MICR|nr:hypothetical protein NEDG_00164 [Nematocida displodere]
MGSMYFQAILAVVAALVAVGASVCFWMLRKPVQKKIVIIGGRGTGKTKLFLALSKKEAEGANTLPTVEENVEKLPNGTLLIDTPGHKKIHMTKTLSSLAPTDTVLYLFNKREGASLGHILPGRIVKIYTGPGEVDRQYSKYSLSVKDAEKFQKEVRTMAKELRL